MPFSSLTPEKQKFLSRYFKPKTFFSTGTPDAQKDDMADALIAFQQARSIAAQKLAQLQPTGVNLTPLIAELRAADAMMADPKSLRSADARQIVEGMLPKIAKIGDDFCKAQKKRAKDAVDLVKTYLGMALEIPKLEARLARLTSDCGKDPVDFEAVKTAADVMVAKQAALKIRSDAYRTDYNQMKANIKDWCDDRLPSIADDLVKPQRQKVETNIATAYQKLEAFSLKLAETMASTAYWKITALQKLIKEKTDYLALKATAETEIAKIMVKRNPGVDEACKGIEADQAKAEAFEDAKAFYDATLIMQAMAQRVADLLGLAQAYDDYEAAAKTARSALEAVAKHPQFQYVQPDYQDLIAHYQAAEQFAAAAKYPKAQVHMQMLPDQCAALETKAAGAAPYDTLGDKAETGDLPALLAEAKKLLATLNTHPGAALLPQALADCQTKISLLENLSEIEFLDIGRAAITKIIELLISTRMALGTANMHHARAVRLQEQVKALRSTHIEAFYIKPALDKIDALVKAAKTAAINGDIGIAGMLTNGEAQLEAANALANAEELYRIKRQDLETRIKDISKDSVSFPDKAKTLAKIAEHMKAGDDYSKAFNHLKAGGMMKAVETLLLVATIGTKANAGTPPSKDNIKKLIAAPGGEKILDDMIAALPATAQKDVLITVLEARFNMDVKLFADKAGQASDTEQTGAALDVPAPNLMAYYEMLKAVPASHTKLNPSMARFDQVEDDSGSYYQTDSGGVVMACFVSMNAEGNPLGSPAELDSIDPDSTVRTDTPNPSYGKWTTLHEVGHAVDDRQSFMDKNGSSDAYGGWTTYGSNIAPVAKAVAAHFKYDNSYIERVMAGGAPALPDMPPDLASKDDGATEWAKRRTGFEAWYAGVRTATDVWDSASETKKWAIGGIMYHEAYDDVWVSYKVASRSKGVTGYQFRAPGEWFSELYAAFHTNKLNQNHPARKWLAAL